MKAKILGAKVPAVALAASLALLVATAPRSSGDQPAPQKETIPAGYKVIEEDILVLTNAEPSFAPAATYLGPTTSYWLGGIVPYEFDANVTAENRNAMLAAMDEWQAVANVQFLARSIEWDYVHIQASTVNNSPVGRQGFEQVMNITSWGNRFIMGHELGHTLGFWHEQSRGDRDQYIRVETANIQAGAAFNFDLHNEANHYGPYDFDSVMHYGACFFSMCPNCSGTDPNCRTITVLPPNDTYWQTRIGQRDHLSQWDKLIMSFIYSYSNDRFVDWLFPVWFGSGTFSFPYADVGSAEASVPDGGFVWILRSGYYSVGATHSKPMTISAPIGGVTLGL